MYNQHKPNITIFPLNQEVQLDYEQIYSLLGIIFCLLFLIAVFLFECLKISHVRHKTHEQKNFLIKITMDREHGNIWENSKGFNMKNNFDLMDI